MVRIFRVDPALDGVLGREVVDPDDRHSGRHLDLLPDQVEVGDYLLGDRVLHLDSGVHFHEVEVAVLVHQELDGSRPLVFDEFGCLDRRSSHLLAKLVGHEGRWGLLGQLLVPSLHRAVTLGKVTGSSLVVTDDLNLDVPGFFDQLLHVHAVVAEGCLGLLTCGIPGGLQVLLLPDRAHALSSSSGSRLEHDRVTDLLGDLLGLLEVFQDPI